MLVEIALICVREFALQIIKKEHGEFSMLSKSIMVMSEPFLSFIPSTIKFMFLFFWIELIGIILTNFNNKNKIFSLKHTLIYLNLFDEKMF